MHKSTTQLHHHHHHYDCDWFWGFRLGCTNIIRKNCERTHHVQLHACHKEINFVKRTEVFKTADCTYRCLLATVLPRVSLKSSHDYWGFVSSSEINTQVRLSKLGFLTCPTLQITIFHGQTTARTVFQILLKPFWCHSVPMGLSFWAMNVSIFEVFEAPSSSAPFVCRFLDWWHLNDGGHRVRQSDFAWMNEWMITRDHTPSSDCNAGWVMHSGSIWLINRLRKVGVVLQ